MWDKKGRKVHRKSSKGESKRANMYSLEYLPLATAGGYASIRNGKGAGMRHKSGMIQ